MNYNSVIYVIFLFQISDIVVGQEDLTAKEALLRWAQKTTHKYPGVKVQVIIVIRIKCRIEYPGRN